MGGTSAWVTGAGSVTGVPGTSAWDRISRFALVANVRIVFPREPSGEKRHPCVTRHPGRGGAGGRRARHRGGHSASHAGHSVIPGLFPWNIPSRGSAARRGASAPGRGCRLRRASPAMPATFPCASPAGSAEYSDGEAGMIWVSPWNVRAGSVRLLRLRYDARPIARTFPRQQAPCGFVSSQRSSPRRHRSVIASATALRPSVPRPARTSATVWPKQ